MRDFSYKALSMSQRSWKLCQEEEFGQSGYYSKSLSFGMALVLHKDNSQHSHLIRGTKRIQFFTLLQLLQLAQTVMENR